MKIICDNTISASQDQLQILENLAAKWNRQITFEEGTMPEDLSLLSEADLALVFIILPNNKKRIRQYLENGRELRMPYTFLTDQMQMPENIQKVLLPIGFLEEEVGKAQYAAAFGRFCGAEITIVQPNDYGSRAEKNIQKSIELFDKFGLRYQIVKGKKDSFKIEQEAASMAADLQADILIISSSRDYGLDDILFGPKEQHVIQKAHIPVMVINPRKDLYSLCD